jgi:hypothetical protein
LTGWMRGDRLGTADDLRSQIGRRHAEAWSLQRQLALWSSGAAVATWAFRDIGGHRSSSEGLFASLNQDARETLECLALVPLALMLALALLSLLTTYGSFYRSARDVLVGDGPGFSAERGVLVNQLLRQLGRGWMGWLVIGWWACALAAGGVTVAVGGALLRGTQSGWLIWALIFVLTWLILKLEALLTTRRYTETSVESLPSREEATRRMARWRADHPGDTSGMPWIYGFSGLTEDDVREEFKQLGMRGPVGFTAKVFGFVVIVLIYSALPAPSVETSGEGLIACLFVKIHDFAGVAEENLGLAMVGAVVLLGLLPLSVVFAYARFMVRYHFPPYAIRQVIRQETDYALRMPVLTLVALPVVCLGMVTVLWVSAAAANGLDSPLVGLIILTVPVVLFVRALAH